MLASTLVGSALVLGGTASPARAATGTDCPSVTDAEPSEEGGSTDPSAPLEALQIVRAQELVRELSGGKEPGEGVQVAVVDSGVVDDVDAVPVHDSDVLPTYTKTAELTSGQGTGVAGIIAGASRAESDPEPGVDDDQLVGIAPRATIYDMRVYDAADSDDVAPAESAGVAEGLRELLPLVGDGGIQIVTVALDVAPSDELEAAVEEITAKGAIVVAMAGDRVPADDGSGGYELGEDAATEVYPAGYGRIDDDPADDTPAVENPLVVAVTTTAPGDDPTAYMLQSSAIDVAVPTAGAVSYGLNGEACNYPAPSTVVAAAEVSGILALLFTAYPDDKPAQIVARLLETATGGGVVDPEHPDTRVGHGVVQPLEALNRALAPAEDGTIDRSVHPEEDAEPAALPEAEPDVLAETRSDAVWWGLFGGGALLLAVLLRPVLSRRRTAR